jgi:DNA helicase-4
MKQIKALNNWDMKFSNINNEKIIPRKKYTFKKKYISVRSTIFFIKTYFKLYKYKNLFESLSPDYELSKEQKKAVISDENRNLVIAGAGTGKTSLMIAKAGYLIKKKKIDLDKVLLLSFGKEPQTVLEKRGKDFLDKNLNAHTFHSYGKQVCEEVLGKLVVTPLELETRKHEDIKDNKLDKFIYNELKKIDKKSPLYVQLIEYFSDYFVPARI